MDAYDSTSTPDALLAQAIAHHQAGRLEEALKDYDAILASAPDHALVLHNRGLLLGRLGRHAQAVNELRRAVQLAPDEGEFWLSLARGLVQTGEPGEALDIVDHVQSRGYQSPTIEQLVAQASAALPVEPNDAARQIIIDLYNAGRHADMEQATQALLARHPQSTFGWSVLGTALQLQGKNPTDALQRLIVLAPHDAEAHTHLGDALQNAGDPQASLPLYLRAIELAPQYATAHCNLGSALDALGRHTEAQQSYRRALGADPGNLAAHFNLGNSLRDAGQHGEAVASYRAALALAPQDPQLLTYLADTLRAMQRYDEALPLYRQVIDLLPDDGEAWANLGTTLQGMRELDGAIDAQLRAVALDPGLNALHGNLALLLHAQHRNDEAEQQYRLALAVQEDDASLHRGLGDLLCQRAAYADSLAACERALALDPDDILTYFVMASAQQGLQDYEGALRSYDRVRAVDPEHAEAWLSKAIALQESGDCEAALAHYEQGLRLQPDAAHGYANMGVALHRLGRHDESMAAYQRALELEPDLALAHANVGALYYNLRDFAAAESHARQALVQRPQFQAARRSLVMALKQLERHAEAIEQCLEGLAFAPDDVTLHSELGRSYRTLGRDDDAMLSFERALEIEPGHPQTLTSMVPMLVEEGRIEDAEKACRQAIEKLPDEASLYSNLLFLLSHICTDPERLFEEHCSFADRYEAPRRGAWSGHDNLADPDRKIRVGFVSGDFNNHALTNFFEPVAILLSREPSLELHAFYNKRLEDAAHSRLRPLFAHWHNITELNDAAAASLVRSQGIDILVDLAGHSAANRLGLFTHKPAPIQASWLGYAGTTGLLGVDYFLTDSMHTPEGRYERYFTEHLVRMPLVAPFLPVSYAPPIHPLPALANGYLTFGTFSRANKLSREVINLWARVLRAVPDARLLLGGLGQGRATDTVLAWFAAEGIARERLDPRPRGTMKEYLLLHREVDVCLNPFPYTGATTLLHAAWMGVPTLTLSGPTMASHGSATYLNHLGLDAFVTEEASQYVDRAEFLSRNIPQLAALRITLRDRYNASVVGQPAVAGAGLERAFRIMWQRWCANIAPGPFRIALEDILPQDEDASV
ncbi:tetratricopeptide repeat protein [Duganella sp. FT27W]|uniref:tetratricopeptide repeat protein n=1 Tax=Duganella sp. FT27W TaxID=2654636 RepID=UPI00128DDA6F|nr:tetratricopeptide repeat protein [Duganella sp. FT27W]MPQ55545.1 tetratricopeptide repeat protein [Duganella sp. FT27W]